ncbi:MAG: DUF3108 domain-containing protein [Oligoflexia bacterium]|nr:DUF3108 domain-containing protein [Oligoflexia bacterium]
MLRKYGPVPAFFAVVVLVAGCASGSLTKIAEDKELPQELQKKFEVKEAVVPAVAASPLPADPQAQLLGTSASSEKTMPAVKKPMKKARKAKARKVEAEGKELTKEFSYPNRRPQKEPIWPGESLVYDVSYFGVSAGDFTMEVQPFKVINGRKAYHARGTAVSSSVFSIFYRLNDMVETFFDYEGLFSHRFHILLDETKQTRDSLELNDSEKSRTFYWNRWNRLQKGYVEIKDYFPAPAFAQDSMSALYYLRSRDLQEGAVFSFPVISEGKNWEAIVTVLRRETINTPLGKMKTIVLKPDHKYQGILKKSGDSFIWLSDDDRKFLVRLEAKVRIGTVVASLKKINPGTAPAE